MRKKLVILFLGIIYLVCSSRSCNEENSPGAREKARLTVARDSILETFEHEYLNDAELHAYEQTAVQKLMDIPHYLQILADTAADYTFREKAGEILSTLFLTEQSGVWLIIPGQKAPVELNDFIDNALHNQYAVLNFEITNIRKPESLKRRNDTIYSGVLQYSTSKAMQMHPADMRDSLKTVMVEMHVVRMEKAFGQEKVKTWKVLLGEMWEREER